MYKIAIPSFRRVEILQKETLAYLRTTNVDVDSIYLFVANEEERQKYEATGLKNIVVGIEGIRNQRNFIRRYFKQDEHVFSIDDDVKGLFKAYSQKKLEPVKDLDLVIRQGFKMAADNRTKLWGVAAVKNGLFMFGKQPTNTLKYIVGAAFGQVIDHDKSLDQTIDDKGDYERSILYYHKFGSVMRYNDIAVETNYYKTEGGMQVTRTKERVMRSGLYLLNKYPEYCRVNTAKKNQEFFEIRLHHSK